MSHLLNEWIRAMRDGDYERAWALDGDRLAARPIQSRDDYALPYHLRWVWDGHDPTGRDVLVRCYHGLGDTIQFLRFLPELRRRAARVRIEVQPRLIPLLGDAIADRLIPFDPTHPHASAECDIEIMELSFALQARPAAFPPPYLKTHFSAPVRGTIGVCTLAGDWDETRSIPPGLLLPLCEGRECITLDSRRSPLPVRNPKGCPFDIAETAQLIAETALVITVDTMVAHLAGAMDRPTWLLLKHEPDWRWSPASGRSEWYPSMRLYGQPEPGDWASVVAAVTRDLDALMPRIDQSRG